MDLSIIIVNYNVKHFLFQCLDSVLRATQSIHAEVIVVDNNSSDDSETMVRDHYPTVNFIANSINVGFAKANNQGIDIAKGKYCVLLNPDTIVQEDTFTKCIDYLNQQENSVGLGIKMIDGSGQFLPESKRSFPSPAVAFYKLFGLAKLFKKNKKFGQYHLTYLNKDQNHFVDVLSGAFFMANTEKLREIDKLDEEFFMYGEDIDLSYRMLDQGEKNIYFADSFIVHYKGESTKKGSLNYVKQFYKAMIQFAEKHFESKQAKLFSTLIWIAILFRGSLTVLQTIFRFISFQLTDILVSFGFIYLGKELWEEINPKGITEYPLELTTIVFPIYTVLFFVAMYFSSAYDRPFSFSKLVRGAIYGVFLTAIVQAFFPADLRFSRVLILMSGIAVGLAFTLNRFIHQFVTTKKFSFYGSNKRRVLIVGNEKSLHLSDASLIPPPTFQFLGLVSPKHLANDCFIGQLSQFKKIVASTKPTDIIFDTEQLSYKHIVESIEQVNNPKIRCHTSLQRGEVIISSHSKNEAGRVFLKNKDYNISKPTEKRKKRLFDIIVCFSAILAGPVLMLFQQSPNQYWQNIFLVLFNQKTWIGYNNKDLPILKQSVIDIAHSVKDFKASKVITTIQCNYAKHYTVYEDIDFIFTNFKQLGNKS